MRRGPRAYGGSNFYVLLCDDVLVVAELDLDNHGKQHGSLQRMCRWWRPVGLSNRLDQNVCL